MRVHVFASGSSGNCLLLENSGTNILLDAGISMRKLVAALETLGLSLRDIGGVLITHEHSDHISGLKTLIKQDTFPVFAPHTVANRLIGLIPDIDECLHIIPVGEYFQIGSLRVVAFPTPHDTDMSVGYRVEGDAVFALATDMGHVSGEVMQALLGADTVLIEANHDEQLLTAGRYPIYLKRRILSQRGHLSNADCAVLASALAHKGTERIILGHLSRENNTPRLALSAVKPALDGTQAELYCAPVLGDLTVEVGKAKCLVSL